MTASGPVANLLSLCGLNILLLLHMSCGWLQDCTAGRFIDVAAQQIDGMTDLRFTQRSVGRSHWTLLWQQFGSDFTALLCCDWKVQQQIGYKCLISICYPSDQAEEQSLLLLLQIHLKRPYVSTYITVSVGRRQQSALQQFGFIIKAPATVISNSVPCITVCRGSRTSKETVCHLLVCCENVNQDCSYKDSYFVT
jgi:hypothetical protein